MKTNPMNTDQETEQLNLHLYDKKPEMMEHIFVKNHFNMYIFFWSMSHLLTCLWRILLPAMTGKCFGFFWVGSAHVVHL